MRQRPDKFIGFASVNPNYRGPAAAVKELERSVTELGLHGLKLYPMYQDWSPADPVLAFPVFEKAAELGIPVLVHQAGLDPRSTPAWSTPGPRCSTPSGGTSAT